MSCNCSPNVAALREKYKGFFANTKPEEPKRKVIKRVKKTEEVKQDETVL